MVPFKEYFKVLLNGKPDEFIENYFNNNDKPYPERFDEFEKQLRALYNSNIELTEQMQETLDEIDDVESGYGNIDDQSGIINL